MLPANHIAMQVEDAPLDQLVDFDNELNLPDDLIEDQVVPPEQRKVGNDNHQLNVGMVLIRDEGVNPAFVDWERRKNAEATRAWAKFFYPGTFC